MTSYEIASLTSLPPHKFDEVVRLTNDRDDRLSLRAITSCFRILRGDLTQAETTHLISLVLMLDAIEEAELDQSADPITSFLSRSESQ